jgi:hypothetical protein
MSWETRGSKQYYYRRRKVNGRVIGEYLGTGYAAHLMHLLNEYERQERQERRQAWQATVDADKELDTMLDEVTEAMNVYADALMIATGHHRHKRQWRKQRSEQRKVR